jgi:hypothetical protein
MPLELEFEERFEGDSLDPARWVPYYLPHWSSRERSAARYRVGDGVLRLLIEADQEPWCPELDGELRVSSVQTGVCAGPLGTPVGQHRFKETALVREEQANVRLYTPASGRVELRARANADPRTMVSLWMMGYEGGPRSGEVCVCEIFGRDVGRSEAKIGVGIKALGDPSLPHDFEQVTLPVDARDFHVYAAEWTPDGASFTVDGEVVKTAERAPDYPLQLMLGIYEFPPAGGDYPKEFVVDYVRGYRPSQSAAAARA